MQQRQQIHRSSLVVLGSIFLVLSYPDWVALAPGLPVPPAVIYLLSQILRLMGILWISFGIIGTITPDPKWISSLDHWLSVGRRSAIAVIFLVVTYVLVYIYFTYQRHYFFNSAGFDLGLQSHVVWNTAQGDWFATTLEQGNYLGDHFQPLMALLAIPYKIYPSVLWLLFFQSLCLGIAAVPLFSLARRKLGSPFGGLVIVLAYLLYPPLGYVNRFDFHFECIVVPLFFAAWDAIDLGKLSLASLFLALSLSGKEEVGLTVVMLGFVAMLQFRRFRFGFTWMAVGVGYSVAALFILIPMFRSVEFVHEVVPFASSASADALDRYYWLGATPVEIIRTILLDPIFVLQGIHQRGWFYMLLTMFAPVAFTALFSPLHLIALAPTLAINLLSDFPPQHTSYYQYITLMIPIVFISAVYAVRRLCSERNFALNWLFRHQTQAFRQMFILGSIMAFSIMSFSTNNPFADLGFANPAWTRLHNDADVRTALSLIPSDAAVATTNHYVPHLTHRTNLFLYYEYPYDFSSVVQADYLLLNLDDPRDAVHDAYPGLLAAADKEGYGVIYESNGVVLLQRNAGDEALLDHYLLQYPNHTQ